MEASYRRISPLDWDNLLKRIDDHDAPVGYDLEEAYLEFVGSDSMRSSDCYFSIDKDWHALHALLTGVVCPLSEIEPFPAPLGNVVMGGAETSIPATYGQVRMLAPDEVRAVANALRPITADDLQSRFDPEAFALAELYPNPRPGGWDDDELEPLLDVYPTLVDFFDQAAKAGQMVLHSLD